MNGKMIRILRGRTLVSDFIETIALEIWPLDLFLVVIIIIIIIIIIINWRKGIQDRTISQVQLNL